MENNEIMQAAQEEKLYSESELNDRINKAASKRASRAEAKVKREYDEKYGGFLDLLMAGTGATTHEEAMEKTKAFYAEKGVQAKPRGLSETDEKRLAKFDADEIISAGYDAVAEEVDRLAPRMESLSNREREKFLALAEYRTEQDRVRELANHGADPEVYESDDFKSFAKQFRSDVPITKVYDQFPRKTKNIKPMGSMKHTASPDSVIKDYYTPEEAKKIRPGDYDKYPGLWDKVRESMTRWKK